MMFFSFSLIVVPTVLLARHLYVNTPLIDSNLTHIPELSVSTRTSFASN